jgi:Ca2+-binding RTX toxin-like protein
VVAGSQPVAQPSVETSVVTTLGANAGTVASSNPEVMDAGETLVTDPVVCTDVSTALVRDTMPDDAALGGAGDEIIVSDALAAGPGADAVADVVTEVTAESPAVVEPADTVTGATSEEVIASAMAADDSVTDDSAEVVAQDAADTLAVAVSADTGSADTVTGAARGEVIVADTLPEVPEVKVSSEVITEVAADTEIGPASDEVIASATAAETPGADARTEVATEVVADAPARETTELVPDTPSGVTTEVAADMTTEAAATDPATGAPSDEGIAAAARAEVPATSSDVAVVPATVEETSALADPAAEAAEPDVAEPDVTKKAIGALGSEAALEPPVTEPSAVEPVSSDTMPETSPAPGVETLAGAAGEDTFVFPLLADSAADPTRDVISDFEVGIDRIDLSALDANAALEGDQAFTFVGAGRDAVANSVTFFQEGGDTIVQADVNGDATADFSVQLKGPHALTATDFVL